MNQLIKDVKEKRNKDYNVPCFLIGGMQHLTDSSKSKNSYI